MIIKATDMFCGAGGTSTGLINAARSLGYELDLLAINHWKIAIETHKANHPWARHLPENLDSVNPREAVPGGYLNLLVASPECTHHSRARGGRPVSDQSRASAFHILRWAEALYIQNILVENVPEFQTWGPLDKEGNPVKRLKGKTYLAFLDSLRSLGYDVDARVINCADYGDPTTRQRLFIMARREHPVRWPEPMYSRDGDLGFLGKRRKWRPAREIIDWSLASESIFTRKKPLSLNTMRRIMRGLEKFGGAQPYLVTYHGASYVGGDRVNSIDAPMPTVATCNQYALCEPYIVACNHGGSKSAENRSYPLNQPFPAVTSVDAWGIAEPYLVKYNGTGGPMSINQPLDTVTAKDRFGLVIPSQDGSHVVVDIKFRMLQPHELAAAMSFPPDYHFTGNRSEKVKQIGNAVPGRTAQALCMALIGPD